MKKRSLSILSFDRWISAGQEQKKNSALSALNGDKLNIQKIFFCLICIMAFLHFMSRAAKLFA